MLICFVQVQLTQQVLSTPDTEWPAIANSLDELANAIETLGLQESLRDVARLLLPLSVRVTLYMFITLLVIAGR